MMSTRVGEGVLVTRFFSTSTQVKAGHSHDVQLIAMMSTRVGVLVTRFFSTSTQVKAEPPDPAFFAYYFLKFS
jgi:hypothetical protein